jgi:hypothetical protein
MDHNVAEEITVSEDDFIYLHYINEQNLGNSPQVKFHIGSQQYSAVVDTGCEASILSEPLYNELKAKGVESLELPTQNVVLVGAFSRKAHRVRKQVFLTLGFGKRNIDQIFLVSEHLQTSMLICCDFCVTNGIILDFQRGTLMIQNNEEPIEVEITNSREVRGVEDCYDSSRNRQVIALPTPQTDPCQLAMVKLPHPLNPSSSEVYPCFSKPGELCKKGREGAFHIMCPSSDRADAEENCSSEDCSMNDGNESLNKCNSIACSDEDHIVRDSEGECGVSILSVAATDRVVGNERKGYYDTVGCVHATKPDGSEVSPQVVFQNINIEDDLSESQKEKLSTLLLKYQAKIPKSEENATASNIGSSCKGECRSPGTADPYHLHYVKKCKNK